MKVLVTGAAGFVGFHTSRRLLQRGDDVVGVDNLNDYYDVSLKEARLAQLEETARDSAGSYAFHRLDLADSAACAQVFADGGFDRVINLAAQAGVRYSLQAPMTYVQSNLVGFTNVLEGCRNTGVGHLTYASTSSVYGANRTMPFSEKHGVDHPLQLYAATKRANELMAHSYSHLFALPTTALRFFTVYGPWGRPDMALFLFTRAILAGEPIQVYNHGNHTRDFTYIDDIVEGVIRASDDVAAPDPDFDPQEPRVDTSSAPFRVFNIGNNAPVTLSAYIEALEDALGIPAIRELKPMQPGDVPDTYADVSSIREAVDYRPTTSVREGVQRFVDWYKDYYYDVPNPQRQAVNS